MQKFDIIRKYRNLINHKYYGISLRMTHLLDNISQIGGDIIKLSIDNIKYKVNIIRNEDNDNVELQLVTIDGSLQCGLILIDKTDPINKFNAIIQDVHAFDTCYESTIEDKKSGKIVMKIMIEICKKIGVKKIMLTDTSHIPCGKYSLDLKLVYTMTHGVPWYHQFGFRSEDKANRDITRFNYQLLKDKMVKDFDKNVFVDPEYISLYDKHYDVLLGTFISKLSHINCVKFAKFYKDIYRNLGLKEIISNIMILNL
jgi:hypothetical protein